MSWQRLWELCCKINPQQGLICFVFFFYYSGGFAAAVTTPLDVAKTRIMLAKVKRERIAHLCDSINISAFNQYRIVYITFCLCKGEVV